MLTALKNRKRYIVFFLNSIFTWNDRIKLQKIDESLDAVADGIDHGNEDEDAGDEDISSFPLGWLRKKVSLIPDGSVDEIVQNNKKHKWDCVDENGDNCTDLKWTK